MTPEKVTQFLDLLADLMIEFYKEQEKLIGSVLVKPGHGFASSQVFEGFGMSDDNLIMVDAAFTAETDPSHNPVPPFVDSLINTGIILNARMVGDTSVIKKTTTELWRPSMRLLAATYSQTVEEQAQAYRIIHEIYC